MGSPAQAVGRDSIVPFLAENSNRKMDASVAATFDAGNSFNTKLKETLSGLLSANNERKAEIDALRSDHDQLKSDHDALEVTTTRENDLRKKEIKRITRPESPTLPSLMESLTLKTMPGRMKSRLLMDGQRERMMLAKLRLQTSRTL